jgi:hypothetical protein
MLPQIPMPYGGVAADAALVYAACDSTWNSELASVKDLRGYDLRFDPDTSILDVIGKRLVFKAEIQCFFHRSVLYRETDIFRSVE